MLSAQGPLQCKSASETDRQTDRQTGKQREPERVGSIFSVLVRYASIIHPILLVITVYVCINTSDCEDLKPEKIYKSRKPVVLARTGIV